MPAVCGENVQVIYYTARQDVRRIKNVARNTALAGHYEPGQLGPGPTARPLGIPFRRYGPRRMICRFTGARSPRREMDCPLLAVFPTSPNTREILTSGFTRSLVASLLFYPPLLGGRLSPGIYMILGVRASIGRALDAGIQ